MRSGYVSRAELSQEIERLRSEMYTLDPYGPDTGVLLEMSRQLDKLIVEFQKSAV
jgi:hypothetical protein